MAYKILLVDDEATLRNTLRAYLVEEGYQLQTAHDGPAALHAFRSFAPDLIVLDIMLPDIDGWELLRRFRQTSDVYVIMLTARSDEMDKVLGLSMGADDYVTKPFSPRELVARIKAALRRLHPIEERKTDLVSQKMRLDPEARLAWKNGQSLDLTPIEFDLLQTLMRHSGRVLSREQLIEQVWGYDYYGDDRVVDVHIGRLRKKVEDDPSKPDLIATVWAVGYRFEDGTV